MSIISYTRNMNIVVSILILTSAIIPHFPLALVNEQSNSDKSVKFTSKFTKLVTNGVPIDVSEAPFYVRIHITDDHRNRSIICGGAAVQVNWVVTTASCVTAPNMKQYEGDLLYSNLATFKNFHSLEVDRIGRGFFLFFTASSYLVIFFTANLTKTLMIYRKTKWQVPQWNLK